MLYPHDAGVAKKEGRQVSESGGWIAGLALALAVAAWLGHGFVRRCRAATRADWGGAGFGRGGAGPPPPRLGAALAQYPGWL
jgi:hypothetical protein